ncbi:neo-calmodulin [Dermatophagoides farinae]|uniref:neo-calmodulin n=1 Tax=Dermatophagoides farinae TaxID=6954 RepID=UPI003F644DF1
MIYQFLLLNFIATTKQTNKQKKRIQMETQKNLLYKEIFNIFSKGKKSFGYKELGHIMKSYGMRTSDIELQDMISQMDLNVSGEIEFREFYQFITKKIKRQEAEEELYEAFKLFDQEGNGFIASKDLREALANLGEKFSTGEIDEMFNEFNIDNDGEIFIDEIITKLTKNTKKN